jgi:glutamyl-tRNA synthetase
LPKPNWNPARWISKNSFFNWAYARHTGGSFVFRIEDTDQERDSEESYQQIIEALTWLGLDWDEGIGVGGPDEPYRQSQRTDIYLEAIEKLKLPDTSMSLSNRRRNRCQKRSCWKI